MDINGYVFSADSSCTNDDSSLDSYGDSCSDYYDLYPTGCGDYDTADFNSTV